ncbi:DNA replication licensing factor mcm4 [Cyclospora cayetanensis]|uniref:DNA replication licensing factor MCM4 n=1 Tax=Cyclospora cayetanensis TaxID=88456 RepID=A0A1D3D8N9_9EIME|nr:DNA replication licensing factor mcm4 [Cyclospora cayetanensis]
MGAASQGSLLGGSHGGPLGGPPASSGAASEYGGTPLAIRRVRFARADLGDMGREFLLLDAEMQRLPELPRDVVDPDMERRFDDFLNNFCLEDFDGCNANSTIPYPHIYAYSPLLYTAIVNAPQDATAAFDAILRAKFAELRELHGLFQPETERAAADELLLQQAPRLRLHSKPPALLDSLRSLDPTVDVERLICLRGVVIRVSEVIPEMTLAAFRCHARDARGQSLCSHEKYECVLNGDVVQPSRCPACNAANSMSLWLEQCAFASKQLIKITEAPENLKPGETPQSLTVYAYDELVDSCRPGDRVEITGIFKASPMRVNPRMRMQHSVFRTYVNLLHVIRDERDKATRSSAVAAAQQQQHQQQQREEESVSFSPDLERQIVELSQQPDIYNLLVSSLAPSIVGRDDVKKGILCQLVGGSRLQQESEQQLQARQQQRQSLHRSELHVLLCGDPATAKSQLLQYVHQIAPRCVYTSGRGSSAVGLTVAVSRDPDTREFVLESGAVVLADGGVCCIDEFDKMEENARYDRQRAVVENINLPPSLFSRFDLIYLLLDTACPVADRTLAAKLCRSFAGRRGPSPNKQESACLVSSILSISMSAETVSCCTRCPSDGVSANAKTHPSASIRQLESLLRLSEAIAKLRLSPEVSAADAAEAVRLIHVATFQSLVDPFSGEAFFCAGNGSHASLSLCPASSEHVQSCLNCSHRSEMRMITFAAQCVNAGLDGGCCRPHRL